MFTAFFCGVCLISQTLSVSAEESLLGLNTTAGISSAVTLHAATVATQLPQNTSSSKETAGVINDLVVRLDNSTQTKVSDAGTDTLGTGTVEEVAEEPAALEEVYDFGYENLGICAVDSGYANVRSEATTSSDIEGTIEKDAGCEILGEESGFYKISSGSVEGYVREDLLSTGEEAVSRAKEVAEKSVEVTCDALRVRAEANMESTVKNVVYQGATLPVVEDLGEWIKVSDANGEGYVYSEYTKNVYSLKKAEPIPAPVLVTNAYGASQNASGVTSAGSSGGQIAVSGASGVRGSLVNNALQYVGNPYVWGGTSLTNGADCSGFVLSIYSQYGVYLPHSSAMQSQYGSRISASQAQPGDLFFYSNGGGISHVGIYIGNGQIVHASDERGGIKVSNAYCMNVAAVTSLLGN